jgi:NAD(P)-dependent dehydrogenase (short-subunit alcohol dehydrogenase family)
MAAETAIHVGSEGGTAFVIARNPAQVERVVDEIRESGGAASSAIADLRSDPETEAAFAACLEEFGRIDGLFAVAGGSARRAGDGPVHEATLAGFEAAFDFNAVPSFLAAKHAVLAMLAAEPAEGTERGSIVLMSSVLATSPARLFATHGYAAAKGAIDSLTRTMAAYYAPAGIRVNAVAPGLVATPMSTRAQSDPESLTFAEARQPLAGGILPAESAADLAVFLLSAESRYITGQVIALDGGWSIV